MEYQVVSAFNENKNRWDVSISGEVDIFNSVEMKKSLTDLLSEKQADVRINCKDLEYIDSTALGALVGVLKNVTAFGGKITLSALKPAISKLFRITNLDKVFIIEGEANE